MLLKVEEPQFFLRLKADYPDKFFLVFLCSPMQKLELYNRSLGVNNHIEASVNPLTTVGHDCLHAQHSYFISQISSS
jgi:hypothetical protein